MTKDCSVTKLSIDEIDYEIGPVGQSELGAILGARLGPKTKTKLKESNFKFRLPYYLFQ